MVKKSKVVIEWKRAKKDETDCAFRRTWVSRCGRYSVVESISKFTDGGDIYYALRALPNDGWMIISRHRRRGPAEKACEKYDN